MILAVIVIVIVRVQDDAAKRLVASKPGSPDYRKMNVLVNFYSSKLASSAIVSNVSCLSADTVVHVVVAFLNPCLVS